MEHDHKFLTLVGEVIFRGSPVKISDRYYKSAYFAIKCTHKERQSDGSFLAEDDYFNIHTFKEGEIIKIREGFIIRCFVRRDSRLWVKNGDIVFKHDMRGREGEKENFGKYPIIFESYELVSKIDIIDDSINQEALNTTNKGFEYFLSKYF